MHSSMKYMSSHVSVIKRYTANRYVHFDVLELLTVVFSQTFCISQPVTAASTFTPGADMTPVAN